ncbi:MAG: PAS domain S-box protein, partial [Actinomycetota bacterium]|nr:PAS domain S-box protein [Actinomycetota bacterium]
GDEDGYLSSIRVSSLEIPDGLCPTGITVREGKREICDDFSSCPYSYTWKEETLKRGYRSCGAFPLVLGTRTFGALTLYSMRAPSFGEEEIELLDAIAEGISFAIQSIEKEAERAHAEAARAQSERYFKALIEQATEIIVLLDADGAITYVSPSVERVLGYKRGWLRGRRIFDILPEESASRMRAVLDTFSGEAASPASIELEFTHWDGSSRVLEVVSRKSVGSSGEALVIVNAKDVTSLHEAKEELERLLEIQRALLDALSDVAFLMDKEGNILVLNNAAARQISVAREAAEGENLYRLLPRPKRNLLMEEVEKVLSSGEPRRSERELGGKYYDLSIYPLPNTKGNVIQFAIISRDITERHLVEEAQRKDREFISAVLDTAAVLVMVLDSEGRVILFNQTCERVSGFRLEEIRGQPVWGFLLPPSQGEKLRSVLKKLEKGEEVVELDNFIVTREGKKRLISWSNTALRDENGLVTYIIQTGVDVTDKRLAEEALRESEERYRSMFESTGTVMCIVDSSGRLVLGNKEFERITGYKVGDTKDKLFADFVLDEDRDVFEFNLENAKSKPGTPVHFECRIVGKNRDILYGLVNIGALPGGNPVISLIDITREKNYEDELRETADRLRHFLAVASHELRHPITVVKGYANTLSRYIGEMTQEQVQDILGDIDSSTDRLTRYVSELMEVSMVEEGRLRINRQEVSLSSIVLSAIEEMKMLGSSNEYSVNISPGIEMVRVDPDKVSEVLIILLGNASKFSPEGSKVQVRIEREGSDLLCSVIDEGIGVPEEDREKIFDRFYQEEDISHHSTPGIGLGLYIAKEILEGHGGKIWCEGGEVKGSIFRFRVPDAFS